MDSMVEVVRNGGSGLASRTVVHDQKEKKKRQQVFEISDFSWRG